MAALWLATLLFVALPVFLACQSSAPSGAGLDLADRESAGPVTSASATAASGESPRITDPELGAEGAKGPVRLTVGDPEPFAPVLPEGIVGLESPRILSEPAAAYRTTSEPEDIASVYASEVPEPKRRREPLPRVELRKAPEVSPVAAQASSGSAVRETEGDIVGVSSAVTVLDDFDSLDFDDNSANTGGFLFIPPDSSGAAGPDHVVNVVNVSLQFHTKAGTELLDSVVGAPITGVSLASFFAPLSPVNNTFDPKVIYDQHADRFVVVTLERQDVLLGDPANTSRILVAVSDDSDPNGTWHQTSIDSLVSISAVDNWADYPGFAVDEEAVYITANMFGFLSSGGAFGGVRLWVIDKFAGAGGGFYGGGTATVSVFDPYAGAGIATTTQPAHIFGTAPTMPNVGTFLVSYSGLSNGLDEFVQIVRIDDPVGPGPTTFTQQFLSIGNIEDFSPSALPDASQSGSAELVETNDRRALHSVWRDDNSLWMTTTIDPVSGANAGEATAHWWELDTTTLAAITNVQQGDVGGDDIAADTHTFFPSIAVNDSGDVAIGFSASAATIFPGSYFVTRQAGDAAGSTGSSATLRAGLDFYIRTFDSPPCSMTPARNRWGDYSGMALDPFDQCFWVYNQHAVARGTGTTGGCNGRPATEDGRWGTAFAYFCESCATNLELASETIGGVDAREARDRIEVTTVTVENTGNLTLTSDLIALGSGFTVESGGTFKAVNGPCS